MFEKKRNSWKIKECTSLMNFILYAVHSDNEVNFLELKLKML